MQDNLQSIATTISTPSEYASLLAIALNDGPERQRLINLLEGPDLTWIKTEPLQDVVLRLLALNHGKNLSGPMLASLARRLIKSEDAVGGPYFDSQSDRLTLNILVAQFFRYSSQPLPKTELYVEEALKRKLPSLDELQIFGLTYPHKMFPDTQLPTPLDDSTAIWQIIKSLRTSKMAETPVVNYIMRDIWEKIQNQPAAFAPSLSIMWKKILEADAHQEISLLSEIFVDSIIPQLDSKRLHKLARIYGSCNFYAWVAYSIYDDFIDGEGVPSVLPTANFAHQESLSEYSANSRASDQDLILSAYRSVDEMSMWELENSRFKVAGNMIEIKIAPNYRRGQLLSKKSIGHVLGPLLIARRVCPNGESIKHIRKALEHYLIARQLNDDMHDWQKDFAVGQISYVVSALLKEVGVEPGSYELEGLMLKMKKAFWETEAEKMAMSVIHHIRAARAQLRLSGIVRKSPRFDNDILRKLENVASSSIQALRDQRAFVYEYKNGLNSQ